MKRLGIYAAVMLVIGCATRFWRYPRTCFWGLGVVLLFLAGAPLALGVIAFGAVVFALLWFAFRPYRWFLVALTPIGEWGWKRRTRVYVEVRSDDLKAWARSIVEGWPSTSQTLGWSIPIGNDRRGRAQMQDAELNSVIEQPLGLDLRITPVPGTDPRRIMDCVGSSASSWFGCETRGDQDQLGRVRLQLVVRDPLAGTRHVDPSGYRSGGAADPASGWLE